MGANKPKGPAMYDPQMWAKAGVDPATGLPDRAIPCGKLKRDIKINLRVKDEQDAVNRYVWRNIPFNMSSQEIERLLYQKQSLIFFYSKDFDQFMILPYALDSGLDFWGRYQYVHPVPIAAGEGASDDVKKQTAVMTEYLRNIKLKVIYDVVTEDDLLDENGEFDVKKAEELLTTSAVIIRDYTPQKSENGVPRVTMQDSLLDVMADLIPFSRTALLNSTGVTGVGVNNTDESSAVYEFSDTVNAAALNGKKFIPIRKSAGVEFQELTSGEVAKSDEFLQMLQGYNNLRLSLYGLDNNGLYDKKAYVNNMQSGVSNVGLSLTDGQLQRQHSCNIINSIWGIWFWCDISETVSGMDNNLDGDTYEDEDQTGTQNGGQQNEETEVTQDV